ncbi:MAG TPA: ABC transporter permease [Thermoleophilaceae bacterium]|nr:ABC transporter permease [Thermoleophilaceae bacterium]
MSSPTPEPATGGASPSWIENRSTAGRLVLPNIRELVQYRELAIVLAVRDIQVRYKQTFLGIGWAVLQPLATTAAFTFVFNRLAGLTSEGVPYGVFVLSGMVVWTLFSAGTMRAAGALVENESILTKVYFPRLLLCVSAVLPGLVDLAIGLVLLAVLMAVTGVGPGIEVLVAPAVILVTLVFTLGTGTLLAAINVRYRDVGNAIPFVMQLWLFLSPVAYSSTLAEGAAGWLYYVNPMAGLVETFRWSVTGVDPPGVESLIAIGPAIALCIGGLIVFGRTERRFADVI